jgi:hypothetical protein
MNGHFLVVLISPAGSAAARNGPKASLLATRSGVCDWSATPWRKKAQNCAGQNAGLTEDLPKPSRQLPVSRAFMVRDRHLSGALAGATLSFARTPPFGASVVSIVPSRSHAREDSIDSTRRAPPSLPVPHATTQLTQHLKRSDLLPPYSALPPPHVHSSEL